MDERKRIIPGNTTSIYKIYYAALFEFGNNNMNTIEVSNVSQFPAKPLKFATGDNLDDILKFYASKGRRIETVYHYRAPVLICGHSYHLWGLEVGAQK